MKIIQFFMTIKSMTIVANQSFCWALLKSLITGWDNETLMSWSNMFHSCFCYSAEYVRVKPFNFEQTAFSLAIKKWKMILYSAKIYWDTNPKVKSTVERIHTYIMGVKPSLLWPNKCVLLFDARRQSLLDSCSC